MRLSVALTLMVATAAMAGAQGSARPGGLRLRRGGAAGRGRRQDRRPSGAPLVGASLTLRCGDFRQDARTIGDGTLPHRGTGRGVHPGGRGPGLRAHRRAGRARRRGRGRSATSRWRSATFGSIVTVTEPGGFVAASSTSATKTDAPLIEIPQSVSVITADQMTRATSRRSNEAIQYTGSVGVDTYGTESRFDWINIRGFDQSTYGLFRDNSRWQSGQVSGQIDPYLLQEIDVVKGPSSVLYGQNSPAASSTWSPSGRPRSELRRGRPQLRLARPHAGPGRPRRAARRRREAASTGSPGSGATATRRSTTSPDDRWFIAPALTWSPSDRTTLTVLGDFQRDDTGWSQFLPSQGTCPWTTRTAKSTAASSPANPTTTTSTATSGRSGSLFEHRIDDDLDAAQHDALLEHRVRRQDRLRRRPAGRPADPQPLRVRQHASSSRSSPWTPTPTPAVDDRQRRALDSSSVSTTRPPSRRSCSGFSFATPLDVFDPVYGARCPISSLRQHRPADRPARRLRPGPHEDRPRWIATLAVREDWTDITTDDRLSDRKVDQDDNALTGRVGVTYLGGHRPGALRELLDVVPAGHRRRLLRPAVRSDRGRADRGRPEVPAEGCEQLPHGLPLRDHPDQRQHARSRSTPSTTVQQGEIRSRGFELEAVGQSGKGLSYHASYSNLDQEVTETTDPAVARQAPAARSRPALLGSAATTCHLGCAHRASASAPACATSARGPATRPTPSRCRRTPCSTPRCATSGGTWSSCSAPPTSPTRPTSRSARRPSYCNYGSARRLVITVRYDFR